MICKLCNVIQSLPLNFRNYGDELMNSGKSHLLWGWIIEFK